MRYPIPVCPGPPVQYVTVGFPYPLDNEEWDYLFDILNRMRTRLTAPSRDVGLSDGAQADSAHLGAAS